MRWATLWNIWVCSYFWVARAFWGVRFRALVQSQNGLPEGLTPTSLLQHSDRGDGHHLSAVDLSSLARACWVAHALFLRLVYRTRARTTLQK